MKIKVVVNTWLTSKGGADDTTEAVKIYGNDECTTCNKREEVKKKKRKKMQVKKEKESSQSFLWVHLASKRLCHPDSSDKHHISSKPVETL